MANKRTLKRSINYICGDLFAGLAPKAYYKAIIEDFNKQAIEIVDHIQNL